MNIKKAMKQSKLTSLLNFFSIVAILFLVITCAGVIVASRKTIVATDNQIAITKNATRFINGSANLTSQVRAYSATGKEVYSNAYWDEVNNMKNREIAIENMKEIGITAEEQSKIDSAAAISNELIPLESKAIDLAESGQHLVAMNLVYGEEYNKSIDKIHSLQKELLTMFDIRSTENIASLRYTTTVLWVLAVILIVLVILCQIISHLVIKRRIIRPIIAVQKEMLEISQGNLSSSFSMEPDTSEIGMLINGIIQTKTELHKYIGDISEKLEEMSNNNLNVLIDVDYAGDFGPIKNALMKIVDSLNSTMLRLNQVAGEVSTGSDQVSDASQALSRGVTEQASAVEKLASTMDEISQQIKLNAQNATEANNISGKSSERLLDGNSEMKNMLIAMSEIDNSSKKINNIIKTVSDIAFQTNILALNAAVEAARAGAAGKGFAVVADEVRNLANKSAGAVSDITTLIENSTKAVENGKRLANSTAAILQEVISSSKESTNLVDEIAKASEIQSESVQDILQGVQQISEVVQTNSATAEESAASSEELSKQAQMLKNLVTVFNLSSQTVDIDF